MGHKFASYVPNQEFQDFVRSKRCLLRFRAGHVCIGGTVFCHVKGRGVGGHDERRGDGEPEEGNGWNGCTAAHEEQHHGIKSFERKYGIDLREVARQLWTEFVRTRPTITPAF